MHSGSANTRIQSECRHWLALMSSDDVSDRDRARFETWLAHDPRHRAAFDKLRTLWDDIGTLRELADLEPVPPPVEKARQAHDWHRWGLAAAAAAGVALLLTWTRFGGPSDETLAPANAPPVELATAVAQVREVPLADGSVLTLGAHSRATVEMSNSERRVRLTQGQAFFSVAKDPARPFHVVVGNAVVRVVGTQFDVHSAAQRVRITVSEGVVDVGAGRPAAHAPTGRVLTAGQQIDVGSDGQLSVVKAVSEAQIGAWRSGRLAYEDANLREIVADLNRYGANINLASAQTGTLRITAAFRVDQLDSFITSLPSILPVTLEREADRVELRARAPAPSP